LTGTTNRGMLFIEARDIQSKSAYKAEFMSIDLSPQNEQFIRHAVARGIFHNREEALDEAVELLRRRQELLDHIDEGTRQLHNGEGIELLGEEALRAYFEQLHADGMKRYEASKQG
jgi:putative addiction module CopG family antidote